MKRRGFLRSAGIAPALLLTPKLAPAHAGENGLFAHGVASGDPLADRVILWTHVSLPRGHGPVDVDWQVAADRGFGNVVRAGSASADPARDYCVKVDVGGLAPGTTYYYRFRALGRESMSGRTRTLPVGKLDRLRLAVASCSNYPAGYFTAYHDIAGQTDLDAVIHLGDYIYEYAADGYASQRSAELGRASIPRHELVTLDDYRLRHAQYKSDPDLIAMHATHPMIAVWDDHEVANDAWRDGAENHQPERDGAWQERRRNAWRAYDEWMPIRAPNLSDHGRLFRAFDFADLASLIMLDTRYFGRDRQVDALAHLDEPPVLERLRRDPDRRMVGEEQAAWFSDTLRRSAQRQRWQIIGQQVLVSELLLPDLSQVLDIEAARQRLGDERVDAVLAIGGNDLPMLWDTWDGYAAARERLLGELDTHAAGAVVLTGDIHTSIAGNLPVPGGSRPAAVELVSTSISSPGFDAYLPTRQPGQLAEAFRAANPRLRGFETAHRGWIRVEVTPQRIEACWRHVDRVDLRGARVRDGFRLQASHPECGPAGLNPV